MSYALSKESHEFPSNITSSKPFVCRLAFGDNEQVSSSIWRIWTAKNRPHLFCTVESISSHVKATVHCPSTQHPTFKRHWGFVYFEEGKPPGQVAEMVRATGESRHKATWKGANVGGGFILEWRILFRESSRRVAPRTTDGRTQLMPMPRVGECGVVFVILGEPNISLKSATVIGGEPNLLSEGRLSDGRQVYILYTYIPAPPLPSPSVLPPPKFFSKSALASANDELRVQAISDAEDGSLVLWDLLAKLNFLQPPS